MKSKFWVIWVALLILFATGLSMADTLRIPGSDVMPKLTAAGTLLRLVDSFVFVYGARLLAGLCVLGAGWNLKEQKFAMAIVCIIAAIMIATVPMWIKNIFDIGGSGSIFS